jgi:hypothetical protein
MDLEKMDIDTKSQQDKRGKSKETAIDMEGDFVNPISDSGEAVVVIDDDSKQHQDNNSQTAHLEPSKKQLEEWTHLVNRGMLRAPCTYCQTEGVAEVPFSVFIQNLYKDDVTTLELKEVAGDGSTHVVSIHGEAWRKPGMRGPLTRFRKHLKDVHGMSKEDFPKALSMKNQSTGLIAYRNDLNAYKSKWRLMRQLQIKQYTIQKKKSSTKNEDEKAARLRVSTWRQELSQEDDDVVKKFTKGRKIPLVPISSKFVDHESFTTLADGVWLNDEVMVAYFSLVLKRDELLCGKTPGKKRSHIYRTHFWTKLTNVGHGEAKICDKYDYLGVKSWSKKVPGQDIFSLDKIFFPINEGRMHWNVAVAYMQEHRIEFYDSMSFGGGMLYLQFLMQYIRDEHQQKKGIPLPDEGSWTLIPCQMETPQQENGKFHRSFVINHLQITGQTHYPFKKAMIVEYLHACVWILFPSTVHWSTLREMWNESVRD